jgi:hypothetical protein
MLPGIYYGYNLCGWKAIRLGVTGTISCGGMNITRHNISILLL